MIMGFAPLYPSFELCRRVHRSVSVSWAPFFIFQFFPEMAFVQLWQWAKKGVFQAVIDRISLLVEIGRAGRVMAKSLR